MKKSRQLQIYLLTSLSILATLFLPFQKARAFIGTPLSTAIQDNIIWHGQNASVDPFSGDVAYSLPLEVPPGTHNLTPKLSLDYFSSNSRLKSLIFGLGWMVNFNYVVRDTKNTPTDTADDTFNLVWNGVSYKLKDMGSGVFKTENETFLSIKHQTGSTQNRKGDYWQIKTPDGTTYRLGYHQDSELPCYNHDFILGWGTDQVTDTNGNTIYYTYVQSPNTKDIGAIYPLKIEYNNDKKRVIQFALNDTDNTNLSETYFQGCDIRFARQLKSITTTASGTQVKKYLLSYQSVATKNLLSSVQELGSDNTALPATIFQYYPENLQLGNSQAWGSNISASFDVKGPTFTPNPPTIVYVIGYWEYPNPYLVFPSPYWVTPPPYMDCSNTYIGCQLVWPTPYYYFPPAYWYTPPPIWHDPYTITYPGIGGTWSDATGAPAQLIDVNNDGLPDIISAASDGGNWNVWLNLGNKWADTAQVWASNLGTSFATSVGGNKVIGSAPSELADVNNDGLPDIVTATDSAQPWLVHLNTGKNWNSQSQPWGTKLGVSFYALRGLSGDAWGNTSPNQLTLPQLIDVNGDGLTDVVSATDSAQPWQVWLNSGTKWNSIPQTWATNLGVSLRKGLLDKTTTGLGDINGDGLPDILSAPSDTGAWNVWLNQGDKWAATPQVWANNLGTSLASNAKLGDVNGDGLPDIITFGGANQPLKVYLNTGSSWNPTPQNWGSNFASFDYHTPLADINGDGISDVVNANISGVWTVWLNQAITPDVLSTVTNSLGGKTSFAYTPATKFNNLGANGVSAFPLPKWAVTRVTENNGLTGPQATSSATTFSYSKGVYNFKQKEFRGFGQVVQTNPNGTQEQTQFLQDDHLSGRFSQKQISDSLGKLYNKVVDTWNVASNSGIFITNLAQEKKYVYEGGASTSAKVSETDFQYDPYGNLTKKSELGDVAKQGDERFSYFSYVYNPAQWIVDTLADTYLMASDNTTKLFETWKYYDGSTSLSTAPTKGNLTQETKWLSNGINPVTKYAYDAYGNKTQEQDANNNLTTYTFGGADPTYTYPTKKTDAKKHDTNYTYDLGTGNLLSQTNGNNFLTTYQYDPLGRIKAEIDPYDSATYPTKTYTYLDARIPFGKITKQRLVSGASGTQDGYTFVDGFNREIQTRKAAQDTSKQIVVDTLYDKNGKIGQQSIPHLDASSSAYVTPLINIGFTSTLYDPLERVAKIINPQGTSQTASYSPGVKTDTDENGIQKTKVMDAYNNILEVDEHNKTETYKTYYSYDLLNNLIKIVDANGNPFSFSFDTLNRKISQTDPDMGTWKYAYDAVGNLISQVDGKGTTIKNSYDPLNRVISVTFPHDPPISYQYDAGVYGTLSSATDSAGIVQYTYDQRLRKISETRTTDGISWLTKYVYDAANRLISTTKPDKEIVTTAYDAQGNITSVSGILTKIDYNPFNKVISKIFSNNLNTVYTYNSTDNRLSKIKTGALQDLSYTYDKVGNVLSIVNAIATKTQTFSYDDLYRLITAKETGGYDYSYSYNPIGNLIKQINNSNLNHLDFVYGQNAGVHALTAANGFLQSTPSATPSPSPSPTATSSASPKPSPSPTPSPSATPKPSPSPSPMVSPSPSPTPKPSPTPSPSPSPSPSPKPSPSPSPSPVAGFELLPAPWHLTGNNGASELYQSIPANALNGKTKLRITYNLHGLTALTGDASAIIFDQNGWQYISLSNYGQNGLNSSQTVEIPLSAFTGLNPNADVGLLHTRFWYSGAFTVDITSIMVL